MRYAACICSWVAIAGIAAVMVACGDDSPSGLCGNPPTFARDIAPISNDLCVPCHAPTANRRGAPLDLNFHVWPSVEPVVEEFADSITSGRMPPVGFQPAATADDRAIVSQWRTCGFQP